MLPLEEVWVWSWIRELRSHMPHSSGKKKKKREKEKIGQYTLGSADWGFLSRFWVFAFFFSECSFQLISFFLSFPSLISSPFHPSEYRGPTLRASGTVSGATDVCRHRSCPREAHSLVGRVGISLVVRLELQGSFQTCFQKVFLSLCWCGHIYL